MHEGWRTERRVDRKAGRKAETWTGRGRIGTQTDRQRAGRKAERWTGWGRIGRQTDRQRKVDSIVQNRMADREAKTGRKAERRIEWGRIGSRDRKGQNRQADRQATGRQKSRKVNRVGQTGRLKTQ